MKTESKEFMGMKFYRYILEQDLDVNYYDKQYYFKLDHTEVVPKGSVSGWISEDSYVADDVWVYEDSIIINSHISQSGEPIKGSVIVNSQVIRSGLVVNSKITNSYVYKLGGCINSEIKSSVVMYLSSTTLNYKVITDVDVDGDGCCKLDPDYLMEKLDYTPWWDTNTRKVIHQLVPDEEIDKLVELIKADNSK